MFLFYGKEYKWIRSNEVIDGLMKSLEWMGVRIINARITKTIDQKASIVGELGDLIIKAQVNGGRRLFPGIEHFGEIPFAHLTIDFAVQGSVRGLRSKKVKNLETCIHRVK